MVCHGDYCFPNVLIEDGSVTGYLDLGELAVADRWWDLAVGSWSTAWNIGPGWEEVFLDSYGVVPDPTEDDLLPAPLRPHLVSLCPDVDGSQGERAPVLAGHRPVHGAS